MFFYSTVWMNEKLQVNMLLKKNGQIILLCVLIVIFILLFDLTYLSWQEGENSFIVKMPQIMRNQLKMILPKCEKIPQKLKGPLKINLHQPVKSWPQLETENSDNLHNGVHLPKNCVSRVNMIQNSIDLHLFIYN